MSSSLSLFPHPNQISKQNTAYAQQSPICITPHRRTSTKQIADQQTTDNRQQTTDIIQTYNSKYHLSHQPSHQHQTQSPPPPATTTMTPQHTHPLTLNHTTARPPWLTSTIHPGIRYPIRPPFESPGVLLELFHASRAGELFFRPATASGCLVPGMGLLGCFGR